MEACCSRNIFLATVSALIADEGKAVVLRSVRISSEIHLLGVLREIPGNHFGIGVHRKAERGGHKGRNRKDFLHNAIS